MRVHVVFDCDGVCETTLVGHRVTVHPGRDRQVKFRVYDGAGAVVETVGWSVVYHWRRFLESEGPCEVCSG